MLRCSAPVLRSGACTKSSQVHMCFYIHLDQFCLLHSAPLLSTAEILHSDAPILPRICSTPSLPLRCSDAPLRSAAQPSAPMLRSAPQPSAPMLRSTAQPSAPMLHSVRGRTPLRRQNSAPILRCSTPLRCATLRSAPLRCATLRSDAPLHLVRQLFRSDAPMLHSAPLRNPPLQCSDAPLHNPLLGGSDPPRRTAAQPSAPMLHSAPQLLC